VPEAVATALTAASAVAAARVPAKNAVVFDASIVSESVAAAATTNEISIVCAVPATPTVVVVEDPY
jgi:hypothetical protein